MVGGDLSSGDDVVVAVTVHGDLGGRAPVLRSGAQVSDVVAHAGRRGWSAAGLALLDHDLGPLDQGLVDAYLRPEPPLDAGPESAAMLDLSDGLLRDAGRLAAASGVRLDLDPGAFAADRDVLRSAARAVAAATGLGDPGWGPGRSDVDGMLDGWIWGGGEDHSLLATFPPDVELPAGWTAVGRVLEAPVDGGVPSGGAADAAGGDGAGGADGATSDGGTAPAPAVTIGGEAPDVGQGWDHFRS